MKDFPIDYPTKLKKISWVVGEICGPNPYWHRHLAYNTRGCGLFVKDIMTNIFVKNGCNKSNIANFIDFLCKAFTVYFNSEQGIFCVTSKKKLNPKTGKKEDVMTDENFREAYKEIEYDENIGNELVNYVLEEVKNTYNKMIKR